MKWHEITIHTTEEAEEMISNFLHELGAGGVSIEESGSLNRKRDTSLGQWYEKPLNDIPEGEAVIKGYFSEVEEVSELLASLQESVRMLKEEIGIDTGKAEFSVREVDEEDWANAWKQYFKPMRISERMTIKPTWEAYEPSEGEVIIELDPGMAFGTGTHPTTALCIRTLDSVIRGGEQVIDVGTGSGVLAIAAAKLGAKHVLALDLDPVAVSSATSNTELNQLEDAITIRESDLLQVLRLAQEGGADVEAELGVRVPVQLVVANILAEILLLFMDDVYQVLEKDGIYIASGIYIAKEAEVEQALLATGFTIQAKHRDQDWVAIVAKK
ncbi:50S ribosomal protein L11 methyltransferase [Paenibacillus sp. y28]|uniref:50S ribosomal protein L11 methyltransferase n=1 Tax=Paenibacillus sp. y28 TaxID=3129110 RepID=UPI003017CF00